MKLPKKRGSGSKAKPRKAFLFAYGELQSGSEHAPVIARGILRAGDGDAAAHFGRDDHGIVYGQRLPVTMDTLRFLDEAEGPDYKRVTIDTQAGPAFAYAYVGDDWKGLPLVPDGDYQKYVRDQGAQERTANPTDEDVTDAAANAPEESDDV